MQLNEVITIHPFTPEDYLFMDNRKILMAAGLRQDVAERLAAHATFKGETVNERAPQPRYAEEEMGQMAA